jgi:hypothetical protein
VRHDGVIVVGVAVVKRRALLATHRRRMVARACEADRGKRYKVDNSRVLHSSARDHFQVMIALKNSS